MSRYWNYLKAVLRHKYYVFLAGRRVGNIPLWRLIIHDWTKFLPVEFIGYANWHFGNCKNKETWAKAWLHHANHNPHHHEYWVIRWFGEDAQFYEELGEPVADFVVALEIPETYLREMVADWMGASRNYSGTWDFRDYVYPRMDRMNIHLASWMRLFEIIEEVDFNE